MGWRSCGPSGSRPVARRPGSTLAKVAARIHDRWCTDDVILSAPSATWPFLPRTGCAAENRRAPSGGSCDDRVSRPHRAPVLGRVGTEPPVLTTNEFTSESTPAEHRYDLCRELVSAAPSPMNLTSEHTAGFRMYQRDVFLGPVRVWAMGFDTAVLSRSARLVEESDPQSLNLCLLRHGAMETFQNDRLTSCAPDDLYPIDSSLPFEMRARNEGEPVAFLGVEVPKELLRVPGGWNEPLPVGRLSGRQGPGALLGGMLTSLLADPDPYHPSDGPRLSVVVADLVSALFTPAGETEPRAAAGGGRDELLLRTQAYIRQHLDDPRLDPDRIAAAHHISTGYLHRVFRQEGRTVGRWIRDRRLERARRRLEDPAQHAVPVHRIAFDCGFAHPEVFSRTFRKEFGASPTEYRSDVIRRGSRGR
ncbi:helix-turn-helix domain-containing protein [Nocardiopsis sp. MG754419]|uniref:helix-turn-helix domain-containing protein n=1 Tax=Nocardiopsis sp. MG754419 TaxID=2259865 RepID=UPI0024B16F68|nr:helix-turn-helix domain-containing protein [Nocardiopsis sp. MG754419]